MKTRLLGIAVGLVLGAGCGSVVEETPPDQAGLIDDLEDGDSFILENEGRHGFWFAFHDASAGHQAPWPFAPTGSEDEGYSATTYGGGFTEWGIKVGAYLQYTAGEPLGSYDASGFEGIRFHASGNVPIRVALVTMAARGESEEGHCVPSETLGCNDFYGKYVSVTPELGEYELPFSELQQAGWGQPAAFDPSEAVAIEFQIDKELDFDVTFDELGFY
jgi:hypothetical protein